MGDGGQAPTPVPTSAPTPAPTPAPTLLSVRARSPCTFPKGHRLQHQMTIIPLQLYLNLVSLLTPSKLSSVSSRIHLSGWSLKQLFKLQDLIESWSLSFCHVSMMSCAK